METQYTQILTTRPRSRALRAFERGDQTLIFDVATSQMLVVDLPLSDLSSADDQDKLFPNHHKLLKDDNGLTEAWPSHEVRPQRESRDILIVKLTSACPLRCGYCYDYEETSTKSLSVDQVVSAAVQLLRHTNRGLTLLFHGGEPLLEIRKIDEICERVTRSASASGASIRYLLQTSGIILNQKIVDVLTQHDIRIGLSMDGPPEINDKIRVLTRGRPSTSTIWDQWRPHAYALAPRTAILTTVTAFNVDALPDIVAYFRALGFRSIDFSLFHQQGRGDGASEYDFSANAFCKAMIEITERASRGQYGNFRVSYLITLIGKLIFPEAKQHCRPNAGPCGAANGVTNLQSNGVITGCDLLRGQQYELGHIDDNPIAAALTSPNAQLTRKRFDTLDRCHSCTWKGPCGGTCGGSAPSPNELGERECEIMAKTFEYLAWKLHDDPGLLDYFEKATSRGVHV